MRALDTNVLVRYLAADEPKQAKAAERVIEDCRRNDETLFLSVVVLCELVCVLASRYDQTKALIIATLERILATSQFRIEQDSAVRRSLDAYRNGKANWPDYVIGEISKQAGCRDIVTLDRALDGAPGFTLLR